MQLLHPRRIAAVVLIAAIMQASAAADPAAAADPCMNADALAGEASSAALGRATLCLVNHERRERGLVPVRANPRLARAARRHGEDMVRHRYFTHESRSGAAFTSRIFRSGYLRRVVRWQAGENMAWGAGHASSPRRIVRSWMESSGHRANMLERRFRDLGVGVVAGAPVREGYRVAATYVHDFAVRRLPR